MESSSLPSILNPIFLPSLLKNNFRCKILTIQIKLLNIFVFISRHFFIHFRAFSTRYERSCVFQQTRSPRRRVTDLLKRTAPYGRHSDHYDSTIGNFQLFMPRLESSLGRKSGRHSIGNSSNFSGNKFLINYKLGQLPSPNDRKETFTSLLRSHD